MIFLVALAARLAAAAAGFSTAKSTPARDLLRAPGYSLFLTAITLGHPERKSVAKAADAVLGAASSVVLAALSARLFRRRRVAVATGVLASLHPPFLAAAADATSEPLFLLLLLCAGYLLLAATDRPSSNLAVLAGAVLALAALTRSAALGLVPLLAAPWFDRRYPRRAGAHVALSAVMGFGLVLAPWAVRSAFVPRGPIPLGETMRLWPPIASNPLVIYWALLCLGAAFGLARAERRGAAAFSVAFLAVTLSVHLLFGANGRFRTVSWDPVLLLYAVAGAAALGRPHAGRASA